jgi:hypothetical protein
VRKAGLRCVVYHPDCSYVKAGSFLQVWNSRTPQWDDIKEEYDACNFPSAFSGASEFEMSERGNRVMSFGYTALSHQPDPTTYVQKPAMRKGTALWKEHMQCLSFLQAACGVSPPPALRRFRDFGQLIHPCNFLEGFTVGATDLLTESVSCHLDTHNESSAGFNTVIVASQIKDRERLIQGGYFKRCTSAYYNREGFTIPAIARASVLFGEIVEWESSNPMIPHQDVFCPPACIDKCVRLAPFVHILVDLISTFGLSFSQSLEALLPITFVTASVYWAIGSKWILSKKLPAKNLACAFRDIALNAKNSGSTLSLPSTECIKASLNALGNRIKVVNSDSPTIDSYGDLVSALQTTCGPSGSEPMLPIEDLVTVAVLAGVITHPKLANQACLYRSTPTLVAIKSTFDCTTINQAGGLVTAVSRALDVSPAVSHALFRQMLHLDESYLTSYCDGRDFPGNTIFRAGDRGVTRSVPIIPRMHVRDATCRLPVLDAESKCSEGSVWPQVIVPYVASATKIPKAPRKTTIQLGKILSRSTGMKGSAGRRLPVPLVPCATKVTRTTIKPRNLQSRSTRSSTLKLPLPEKVLSSVIPSVEVVLLRDASKQACILPALDGSRISYHNQVQSSGNRVYWRATCHVNGVTWNPNDDVASIGQSGVSPRFGGLAHSCYHPPGGGYACYNSKSKALDSLLVYMLVYGDGRSFGWVRRTLGDHHFVSVRKKGNVSSSADPLFLIYRHKGNICIGHFKDQWGTRTQLCKV